MKISSEYRDIQIDWQLYIYEAGIANNEIWGEVLQFFLEFSNDRTIIVQLSWDTEPLLKRKAWINLNEGHSLFIIGNFFKFHNLIIIVNSFFIYGKRKNVDNMFMWISDIEYSCYLCVHILFVGLFTCEDFIYYMDLEMLLLLYFWITLEEIFLNLWMFLLHLFSFFCCIF